MTASISTTLPIHVAARPLGTHPRERGPLVSEPYVELADSASDWDAYVARHPGATLYHLYAWKAVAERVYGMRAPFLVARDHRGGKVRGVLPLVRVPRPFAPYLTTGLFGSYGPMLSDDARHARALLSEAKRRVGAGEGTFLHLKMLGSLPEDAGLERRLVWVTALLDVEKGGDDLWRRLRPTMRSKIRHAEKAGLVVEYGSSWFDDFYQVLSENMLRKGSPIYGKRFMRVLLDQLGPRADIVVVRHEGKVISGGLIAWFNGTMMVPFVSSRPSSFHLRPNNLLYWEIARRAHSLGLHTLDFGSSMQGSSGLRFKESWKPRIEPIASYVYAARGTAPDLAPVDSALARNVVKVWSHLPPHLAEALGPAICRWIA